MTIGEKIRRIRTSKRITQRDIANLLGFSEAQISHIEHGNREISVDNLHKIAGFCGVTYESIITKDIETVSSNENLRYRLMRLDWIAILQKAIEARPTSWDTTPVREWRNASDEICFKVIHAMEDVKLIPKVKYPKIKKKK